MTPLHEIEERKRVIDRIARQGIRRANVLAVQRVASQEIVTIALAMRAREGWDRDRALFVIELSVAVLVAAHRHYCGAVLADAIATLPTMPIAIAESVSAVVSELREAVAREWPSAGVEAFALAAILGMFVADGIEALPDGLR